MIQPGHALSHESKYTLTLLCAVSNGVQQLAVNDQALRRAWESSQRSTKEDWAEWMRHFAVELLKESPSHALRATHLLAQVCEAGDEAHPHTSIYQIVKMKTKQHHIFMPLPVGLCRRRRCRQRTMACL